MVEPLSSQRVSGGAAAGAERRRGDDERSDAGGLFRGRGWGGAATQGSGDSARDGSGEGAHCAAVSDGEPAAFRGWSGGGICGGDVRDAGADRAAVFSGQSGGAGPSARLAGAVVYGPGGDRD